MNPLIFVRYFGQGFFTCTKVFKNRLSQVRSANVQGLT